MPQGPSIWLDTRIYLAVAALLLLIIMFYNKSVAVLGLILLAALYLYGRERHIQQQKELNAYLSRMVSNVGELAAYAVHKLPVAIALLDADGRLCWGNEVLDDWTDGNLKLGESILKVWPELPLESLWEKTEEQTFQAEGRHYQLMPKVLNELQPTEPFLAVYLLDITTTEILRGECTDNMPVVAYIQIDNYDDVLQGLSDKQRSSILFEVNKLLNEWVADLEGFIKKYGEDMYVSLFTRKALDKVFQDKFDILDKVRAIHGSHKFPVTLSMGVVADRVSMADLADRAQAGLDLALGRGGDQAAVHVGGKVQFYGGKAKAVEKNTRVKARTVAHTIREIIGAADTVLIMGHQNEDFDSLGAAMGVAKMARHLGKNVYIAVSQNNSAVSKLSELFTDYEEYRELFVSPARVEELSMEDPVLFVVDTHRPELAAAPELLGRIDKVIVIDHHRRAEEFIANPLLVYLEPSSSSTSELVTELLMYFDESVDLTRIDATALYAGIVVDTKNFSVQTGVRTFDAAAYLRRSGADPALIRFLFQMDYAATRARSEVLANAEMQAGGLILADCPANIKNAQVIAAQAADTMLRIEGVKLSIVLFYLEDDGIGVSARSNGEVNVQLLMEELGGGGHQTVAGAQVKNATLSEVRSRIIELSAKYIEESEPE
ncbi:DHH family phosphoesterase|uniref:Cyclic-di-AMP phosphodiesterase n=1 Tax=Dendrosporobacter quercicolus TaxID=146817 RepID=A0A1G9Y133_9FIRM|nr:DHH family phosphoesterase [Dendrosporobacter quercicolus]NSL49032.1 DHH family phosphoesterase [Dendrosporobacter quercicolus DSM 1736]SDN02143.1 c-di-AMP phosphodiesterase, consists of a GGDEF-like and DHH domains [Dendrosporobacter quercicolus]